MLDRLTWKPKILKYQGEWTYEALPAMNRREMWAVSRALDFCDARNRAERAPKRYPYPPDTWRIMAGKSTFSDTQGT